MASFLQQAFEDAISEPNALICMAAGLGMDELFVKFIRYSMIVLKSFKLQNERKIILVLNLSHSLNGILNGLQRDGVMSFDMPIVCLFEFIYSIIVVDICVFVRCFIMIQISMKEKMLMLLVE